MFEGRKDMFRKDDPEKARTKPQQYCRKKRKPQLTKGVEESSIFSRPWAEALLDWHWHWVSDWRCDSSGLFAKLQIAPTDVSHRCHWHRQKTVLVWVA